MCYIAVTNEAAGRSFEIPEGVERIAGGAFSSCTELMKIKFPSTMKYDENQNFYEMLQSTNIEEIEIADGNIDFKVVDGGLLTGDGIRFLCYPRNYSIDTYCVPEGVEVIENSAFEFCEELRNVWIPSSVKAIEYTPFRSREVILHGTEGSYVIEWAKQNGYKLIKD